MWLLKIPLTRQRFCGYSLSWPLLSKDRLNSKSVLWQPRRKTPISVCKPSDTFPVSVILNAKTRICERCARGLPAFTIRQGKTLVSVIRVRDYGE